MLYYTGLLFLVIAVSLDGFGVGISYGMRKIRVPILSIFIIILCSGIVVFLSMVIGNYLTNFIPIEYTSFIGGTILIIIGLFVITNVFRQRRKELNGHPQLEKNLETFKKVMITPEKADIDQSGNISAQEAIVLGIALALDAFGAGIGAAFLGYSPIITTLCIACLSGIFVFSGIQLGLLLSKKEYLQKMTVVPPLLLIGLGFFNILY